MLKKTALFLAGGFPYTQCRGKLCFKHFWLTFGIAKDPPWSGQNRNFFFQKSEMEGSPKTLLTETTNRKMTTASITSIIVLMVIIL